MKTLIRLLLYEHSDLGLHCLPRPICPKTKGHYGILIFSGKTLLLFQAAVSYASQGHHVTFISRRPLTRMPLSVHGMTRPDVAGLLKTLTFL